MKPAHGQHWRRTCRCVCDVPHAGMKGVQAGVDSGSTAWHSALRSATPASCSQADEETAVPVQVNANTFSDDRHSHALADRLALLCSLPRLPQLATKDAKDAAHREVEALQQLERATEVRSYVRGCSPWRALAHG